MKKNFSVEMNEDELATTFFDLINPYKGGQFVLIGILNPLHSSSRGTSVNFAPSPPRSRTGSISPPPLRGLFHTPQATSPPASPRIKSQGPVVSPPISPRPKSIGPGESPASPRGPKIVPKPERGSMKVSKQNVVELSDRSAQALQTLTPTRGSVQLAKSVGKITSLPGSRDRSREPSMNLEEIKLPKLSDEEREANRVEKTFNPVKPTFIQRGKFNVGKLFDKKQAEESKRKESVLNSRSPTPFSTPQMSQNPSPVLSRRSGVKKDFSYWNEIIPNSGLFLGVQPTKSNHPFLIDNPQHLNDVNSCPFLLNPQVFRPDLELRDNIRGVVFTFQEAYEMNGGLIDDDTLLDHHIFHQLGIVNRWLPIADHSGGVNETLALYRLYDMMEFYLRGLPIYLHCKSGKGRSAIFKIMFLAFCFLLDKRISIDKDCLMNYIDIDDPTVDHTKYNRIWMEKRTRLFVVIERINSSKEGAEVSTLITPDEKPTADLLKKLFDVCESVARKGRKIKPSDEQRQTALKILHKLTECLYAEKNTAHPKAKSSNIAFIDELTQTIVLKDIHVHMDGVTKKEDATCKAFQEFLMRLVYNKKGWYFELVFATEGQNHVEGECGYFLETANQLDRELRINFLRTFRKDLESLLEKYPRCVYAKDFLTKKFTIENDQPQQKSEPILLPKTSPRSLSFNATLPRERAVMSSQNPVDKQEDSLDTGMRDRSRTFDKANIPVPLKSGSGVLPSRLFAVSSHTNLTNAKEDDLDSSSLSTSSSNSSDDSSEEEGNQKGLQ